jgi:ParB/RepB/Spo0J family partition protein
MSQPNANNPTNKKLPPLAKNRPVASAPVPAKKGGNSVVLEMLASKMADLNRQQNEEAFIVPLSSLEPNPDQPRQLRDEERDQELAEDIKARGILQPIVVRPMKNGRYQIVAGERRYRASGLAGLTEVPVIVKEYNDEQARYASMVENLQRQDLDPLDEGRFYDILNIQENIGVRAIAEYIHRSTTYVQDRLTKYREHIEGLKKIQTAAKQSDEEAEDNSEKNNERDQQLRKLQSSQSRRFTPLKTVVRFRDFLNESQERLEELKEEEKQELATQLKELREQLQAVEKALVFDTSKASKKK